MTDRKATPGSLPLPRPGPPGYHLLQLGNTHPRCWFRDACASTCSRAHPTARAAMHPRGAQTQGTALDLLPTVCLRGSRTPRQGTTFHLVTTHPRSPGYVKLLLYFFFMLGGNSRDCDQAPVSRQPPVCRVAGCLGWKETSLGPLHTQHTPAELAARSVTTPAPMLHTQT